MKRHPLRILSNILFRLAMLPLWPLCIAQRIAKMSIRLYYIVK